MSSVAITWAWKQTHLKPNQKYVLIACAEFAGMRGEGIYPGVVRLAAMTGYSDRQVTRVLAELVDLGVLVVKQEGGWTKAGKGQATEYEMPVYPSQQGGDKTSPPPGDNLSKGVVTNCPGDGDKTSPQTRTTTKNPNQEPSASVPSSAAVDPVKTQAAEIAKTWWEALDPRPASGSFVGYRGCFEKVLRAGWPPDAVAAAARECGRTVTVPRLEIAMAKSHRRVGPYENTGGSTSRAVTAAEFFGDKPSEGVRS